MRPTPDRLLVVHHTRKQGADDCFDTISGTTGLLGAADGAFVLQKVKRTQHKAILDAVGRDQQDQRLHLAFERECYLWVLEKVETEQVEEVPDPVLEAVALLVTVDAPEWAGTASELSTLLVGLDLPANMLTRRLNVGASKLMSAYDISYESSRTRTGRQVKLVLIAKA